MTAELERHRRKRSLFDAAADLDPAQQQDYLDQHCADDPPLRREVERLLIKERALPEAATGAAIQSLQQTLSQLLPSGPNSGAMLGPYRIIREIGSGGMGRVFAAERAEGDFKLTVAIKLLRQELVNPDLLMRFSSERNLLAALNHPGICRVIDIGSHGDTPYVVMELVEGQPLLEYCDGQRLSIEQRLRLFRQVLAAVSYAHQNLVIHRDLKSSNILVDARGDIKLLDFGIAKVLSSSGDVAQTATADRYLSLGNAAPEQLRGDNLTVACDVYALGTVLYELLCGAPPFELKQASVGALEAQILSVPPAPMTKRLQGLDEAKVRERAVPARSVLRRRLGGDLEAIVQKCLRKEPGQRYLSVERLDQDIDNVLCNRPIAAGLGQRRYVLKKFLARNRLPAALTAVALIALTVTGALILARNAEAIRERDRAQQALAILRQAFLSADPARVAGEQVSAKAVLDAAIPALEDSFQPQPELYATLASSIAEVKLQMGLAASAAQLLDRALDASRRGSLSDQQRYELLVLHARATSSSGDQEGARSSLDRAMALGLAQSPEWLVTRAMTLKRKEETEQAIDLLRQAIVAMDQRGADDEWANTARLRLADALQRVGQHDEALEVLQQMLVWLRSELAATHPRITLARLHLVIQRQIMGQAAEALQDAEQIYADLTQAYGEDSPNTAKAAMILANALHLHERDAEEKQLLRRVVATFSRHLGDHHPNTLRARHNLASALDEDPQTASEALALHERILASGEAHLDVDNRLLSYFRISYAEALIKRNEQLAALAALTSEPSRLGIAAVDDVYRHETLKLIAQTGKALGCLQPPAQHATAQAASLQAHCANAAKLLDDYGAAAQR